MKDRDNYTAIADERDTLRAEVERLKSTLSADWKRAADGQKLEADTLRARVAELEAELATANVTIGNLAGYAPMFDRQEELHERVAALEAALRETVSSGSWADAVYIARAALAADGGA